MVRLADASHGGGQSEPRAIGGADGAASTTVRPGRPLAAEDADSSRPDRIVASRYGRRPREYSGRMKGVTIASHPPKVAMTSPTRWGHDSAGDWSTMFEMRSWLLVGAALLSVAISSAEAAKRRPNGCDWIGGDFAEPGEVIFNTGCRAGVRSRARGHVAGPVRPRDEPPKLLDRVNARAPAGYGASTRQAIGAGIERFQIVQGKVAYGLDGAGRLWRFVLGSKDSTNGRRLDRQVLRRGRRTALLARKGRHALAGRGRRLQPRVPRSRGQRIPTVRRCHLSSWLRQAFVAAACGWQDPRSRGRSGDGL